MTALRKYGSVPAIQTEKADAKQVLNNAGGYVFEVSPISRLERFLILGTDGGTYYVGERDLTKSNVDFLRKMIKSDPRRVLKTVVEISEQGRAYRNEAAIFVMALLLTEVNFEGFKSEVIEATPKVVRTAYHLYTFMEFIEGLGGWGRAKRRAVQAWFESKDSSQLAYQAVKYRSRVV